MAYNDMKLKKIKKRSKKSALGTYCAAINCHNARRNCKLSMFRFPKDKERSMKWVQNTRRQDLRNLSVKRLYTYELCSNHFEDSQFMNKDKKNKLIWNAVPTLFDVPNPPPKVTPSRNVKRRSLTERLKPVIPTKKSRPIVPGNMPNKADQDLVVHESSENLNTKKKRSRTTLGTYCAAINCHNARRNCKLSMFRFPKDEERSLKWVENSGREDLRNLHVHRLHTYELCSNHFEDSQFTNKDKKNRLRRNAAVPTLFDIPNPPPKVSPSQNTGKSKPIIPRDMPNKSDQDLFVPDSSEVIKKENC